jgi:excinuclease ABC subunit A
VREEFKQRLAESFETALRHGDGRAIVAEMDKDNEVSASMFSAKFACRSATTALAELEPRLFSFNSPLGAARMRRAGLDHVLRSQARRGVSAAVARLRRDPGWDRRNQFYFQLLQSLAKHIGFDIDRRSRSSSSACRR